MESNSKIASIMTLGILIWMYYLISQDAPDLVSAGLQIIPKSQVITLTKNSASDFMVNSSRKNNSSEIYNQSKNTLFLKEEEDMCQSIKPNTFLLIYVHSAINHSKHRTQIRQTYGSSKMYSMFGMSTLFFVGQSRDEETNRELDIESQTYHDIIQADFIDHYHNLTFKAISALSWITKHCNRVPFILKLDDDVFVNVFNLISYLKNLPKNLGLSSHMIYCRAYTTPPTRNPKATWYVSEQEYPGKTYPEFCSGSAFFMSGRVIPKLNNVVPEVPFLWIDDIYVTGLLRNKTDIKIHRIDSLIALTSNERTAEFMFGDGLFAHNITDTWSSYWSQMVLKDNHETILNN